MFWLCALAGAWQAFAAAELDEPRSNTSPWLAGFQDPPAVSRAKFRYWLPDASVDSDTVQADIRSAGSVGAGGVEFLPFYNYGGELPSYPAGADWSKYGFGTPAYKKLLQASLEAHAENDLVLDFSLGPNQGQGVPADKDDQGLQWDLVSCKIIYIGRQGANTLSDSLQSEHIFSWLLQGSSSGLGRRPPCLSSIR
ncbi:hypothetical protein NW767_013787 [Fusarium falciforme]|nr:hypothetical protein NW767_013787 [Fusarium falciforme]